MVEHIDTQKMIQWIKINVVEKGLIPANPITAQGLVLEFGAELGETVGERMFYAKQIVEKARKRLL